MEVEEMQKQIESMMPTPQQIVEHLDKKLEEAKELYKTANSDQKYVLERLYPQLIESEDERIRKGLIDYFNNFHLQTFAGIDPKKILSWLEKQSEHANFRNKIQVGDKVTRNNNGELVNLSQLNRVAKPCKGEQNPAWSDEDEKIYNLLYEEYKNIAHYSHSREKAEDIPGEVLGWLKSLKYRVQLQPKQEWNEEDELMLNDILTCGEHHCYLDASNIAWLKELKDRVQLQPRQEWTKEDEEIIGNIRRIIAQDAFYNDAVDVNGELCEKMYIDADNWLKVLKDKVQLQAKQEWSEEDRDYFDAIIAKLEVTQDAALLTDNQMEFLKSLKDRVAGNIS